MSWTIHWYFKGYNENALSLSMGNIQKRRHNLGQLEQGKKYIVAWTQSGGHNINKKNRDIKELSAMTRRYVQPRCKQHSSIANRQHKSEPSIDLCCLHIGYCMSIVGVSHSNYLLAYAQLEMTQGIEGTSRHVRLLYVHHRQQATIDARILCEKGR